MNAILRHLPNTLSGARFLAAPAIAYLLLHHRFDWAFGVFLVAGLSDAVDGYLAKWLAPGSRFGVYLDPAADKLLMLVSFLALTKLGVTPLWLTVVVVARDVAIIAGIGLTHSLAIPMRVAPLPIGKASTAIQVVYVGLMLFLLAFNLDAGPLGMAAVLTTAILTLASAFAYAQVLLRAISLGRRPA